MFLTTVLAAVTALTAIISLLGSARSDHRKLRGHEWVIVFLTLLTLVAGSYQTWDNLRLEKLHTALGIDWERELDSPITSVSVALLFPKGVTVESDIATLFDALRFQFQLQGSTIELRINRGAGGLWYVRKNVDEQEAASKVVYGVPLRISGQHYCWWSDSWGAPKATVFKLDNTQRTDRALCNIEIEVPLKDVPLSRLRSLNDLKLLTVFLDKDPGTQVCAGECSPIVSIMATTDSNRFDISPYQDMHPASQGGSFAWSSTGDGIKERQRILFVEREGFSLRESIREKMGPVDRITEGSRTVLVKGIFSVFPEVPYRIEESPEFTSRFGAGEHLMRFDKWCGFARQPQACIHKMIVVDEVKAKNQ